MKSTSRKRAQKRQMRYASVDLQNLTAFLNLKLGKMPNSILSDTYAEWTSGHKVDNPASPEAVAFAKAHRLYGSADLMELQGTLRSDLLPLVDPDSLIPVGGPREHRDWFKREIIGKYLSNPQGALRELLRRLNGAAIKSQWRLDPALGKEANLRLRGGRWILRKTEFLTKDKIYSWLVRVLERDELLNLGCCRTCQAFFIRSRDWQRDCSPSCKKAYDRILARERRAADAASQETKKAADKKQDLMKRLSSEDFRRRLRGGPKEKGLTQTRVLNDLARAPSLPAFRQQCDPGILRIVDKVMNG